MMSLKAQKSQKAINRIQAIAVANPLSATFPAHGGSAQLMKSASRYPENEMPWKMTVKHSALVTVIFIRDTIGPPMIGPMLHESVVITPVRGGPENVLGRTVNILIARTNDARK